MVYRVVELVVVLPEQENYYGKDFEEGEMTNKKMAMNRLNQNALMHHFTMIMYVLQTWPIQKKVYFLNSQDFVQYLSGI